MKATDFLRDKLFSLVLALGSLLLMTALLWLIGTEPVFIALTAALFLLPFGGALLREYSQKKAFYGSLLTAFDALDDKTLLPEMLQQPDFLDGALLCRLLCLTEKYMRDALSAAERQNREYREYVELWVHEIKTPITSAQLIAENDAGPAALRILEELGRIEGFVEQALYYARSTSLEKDFRVEKTTLKELILPAVKKLSRPIIQAGGQLHFDGVDRTVCADKKWCAFLLGQIIENAVKYRAGPLELQFTGSACGEGCTLEVKDNGVGIPAADLPRVFDKGFTGAQGRTHAKATGLGLYLCKRLCGKMGLGITVSSRAGEGTAVKLSFPRGSYFLEQA